MWERMVEKRNDGGFTLIELLIVIIILAILAAIVVFAVGSTGSNAVAASCNADAKTFETALESFKSEVGAYPGAAALTTGTTNQITYGQTWPNAIAPTAAPNPGGAVFGLLGDNGYSASNTTLYSGTPTTNVGTTPLPSPPGVAGNWVVPSNNATVGPFLRELPGGQVGRQHYYIVTDGAGGVFVYPMSTAFSSLTLPLSTTNNYDTNPAICGTMS
jgi:prepilin-type N-terminal cleavage/methylation domain-containing protein